MNRLIKSLPFLLAALACSSSSAADLSCAQQMGQQRATLLAQQCRQVSPATHPPCNAANSCAMIIDEFERGCNMLEGESSRPKFCVAKARAGSFRGYLFHGGGIDDRFVTVLTDQGDRIFAYCIRQCDDLFSEPDDHDAITLREDLVGKRVAVQVAVERNADRIAGPGNDERIPLVKHIKLLK
ncbi:hypothetical protein C5614_18055 [Massilia phosphatilytica]|jgi:hypothetical protein|nr:hypothetical protein C5614_18055 [Massilia phosphatilytica]